MLHIVMPAMQDKIKNKVSQMLNLLPIFIGGKLPALFLRSDAT